ncbi:hypothetical protein [Kineosporia sp. NBRC 101677]|uniref:hypothetical protein n=1 Tax=Kineosporia sp. NBRC 101677 TaxID=3032197 RepID=UPI002555C75B|nr:hypothetical protein [Kineosporia sp. NBRC 101677]
MPDTGTGRAYGEAEPATGPLPAPIELPAARGMDELGVPTGFPPTQEGALAQLTAIATAAANSSSVPGVERVRQAWVAPGGPDAGEWTWRASMTHLLQMLDTPLSGSAGTRITGRPLMGLVKDTGGLDVGTGWAVVCVDVALDLQVDGWTHHGVVADCQRMLWDGQRWLIGPGAIPAQPVSQPWPGTDAAYEAGYRDLVTAAEAGDAAEPRGLQERPGETAGQGAP